MVPPAGTWAEIFNPNLHASGVTLCADDPNGSTGQFQALQLWSCHGYASNGIPQRWTFQYVGNNIVGPAYRIANIGGSGYCIGLAPNHATYAAWQGTSLVQEACSGTTGSEVVWNLVPATQSPDPNNQFMLISTNVPFSQQPCCVAANDFRDTNGTKLTASGGTACHRSGPPRAPVRHQQRDHQLRYGNPQLIGVPASRSFRCRSGISRRRRQRISAGAGGSVCQPTS